MGKPSQGAGQMRGLGLVETRREVSLQRGSQFYGAKVGRNWGLGGAEWVQNSFRAAGSVGLGSGREKTCPHL